MKIIDLRSDTVTLPTEEMRRAIFEAEVGDDVKQEDLTVIKLESLVAEILGKEAGLFFPSGTMANLSAVLASCQRGDEVILGDKSHLFLNEVGGISALGGVHSHQVKNQLDGTMRPEDIILAVRSRNIHHPVTKLITLENTHNRCGGAVLSREYTDQVADIAKTYGLKLHVDGARLFNASTHLEIPPSVLVNNVDSVSICLSKGLSAPVGSVLAGTESFISRARRIRKQLGGGMRQVGIIASAGIIAIEKMVGRLKNDHNRLKYIAQELKELKGINLYPKNPQTNILYLNISQEITTTSYELADKLKKTGVLIDIVDSKSVRLVTHYGVNDEDIAKASKLIRDNLEES